MIGPSASAHVHPRKYASGFSLIELMVAMVLGLTLMAGLVTLVTNSSRTLNEMTKTSRQLDNGRYAVQVLTDAVQHAGFYGRFSTLSAPSAETAPCSTDPGRLLADLGLPIEGYNALPTLPSALSCLPSSGHVAGTDILIVRRAATETSPVSALTAGKIYLQTLPAPTVEAGVVLAAASSNAGNNASLFDLTDTNGSPAPVREYRLDIYFVSPCREANDNGACLDDVPALKRLEMPSGNLVTIADGIEDLQIDYGVDENRDGTPDPVGGEFYVADPAASIGASLATQDGRERWANVVAARIHVLARSLEPSPGYTDTKTYEMGTAAVRGPFEDNIKRHVFSSAVRATNVSSRRES